MSVNLQYCVREAWEDSLIDQVLKPLPLVAMMMEHKKLRVNGTALKFTVVKDDLESLAQDYDVNDPLTVGEKTVTATVQWNWKKFQLPVTYDVDDEIEGDGDKATAPISVVKTIVEAAQTGARKHLNTLLYGAAADAGKKTFQGLRSALTHDATYGGLARGTTVTNPWWQGASLADTFADQATATTPTIAMLRNCAAKARRYVPANAKLYAIVGESNYAQFQSQVEARHMYTRDGSRLAKYGFRSFTIDDIEMVCDPYLTITGATTAAYFFLLNPETWELRIKPERNFQLTPFRWLGEQANGLDKYLARVRVAGNLVCTKPNANIFLSSVA